MNMLAHPNNSSNQVTMTSLELVDFINAHRKELARELTKNAKLENERLAKLGSNLSVMTTHSYSELRHRDFMAKVPKVLGLETSEKFRSSYLARNGEQRPCYRFQKREACLMAMSYSYELQAQVFDRMTAMENHIAAQNLPSYMIDDPIERAKKWIEEEKQKQIAIQERDHAIATKAEIGSRREATAMATASKYKRKAEKLEALVDESQSFATIKKVQALTGGTYDTYELRRYSKTNRLEIQKAEDANYGSVNSYHKDAWLAVYNINLSSIRGA